MLADGAPIALDRRRAAGGRLTLPDALVEFRAGVGLPGLALRARRASCSRSASSCPTGRTPCTSATGWLPAIGPLRLDADAGAVDFRPHEGPRRPGAASRSTSTREDGGDGVEVTRGDDRLPPLRLLLRGRPRRRRSARRRRAARRRLPDRARRGYDWQGRLWRPARSSSTLAPGDEVDARSPRPRPGTLLDALSTPSRRCALERRAAAAAARAGRIRRCATGIGRRAGAGRRPVHHHARAGRAEEAARARAAGRRGRARSSPATTGSPTGAATR